MGLAMIKLVGRVEGHPRLDFKLAVKKDVDARPKAGHDERELF
jgi:hypothetical protein